MFKRFKKILLTGAAAVMMLSPFSMTAQAIDYKEQSRVVIDAEDYEYEYGEILTESQIGDLEKKIQNVLDNDKFDIVIVATDHLDGKTPQDYADDYYDYNGYGFGKDKDGVLLLVPFPIDSAKRHISTTGFGIKVYSDEKIQEAGSKILAKLQSDDYYGAFDQFITSTKTYLEQANSAKTKRIVIGVLIGVGIGLLAAIITILVLRSQLTSVSFEHGASNYEVNGSFHLTRSQDIFLFRNVKKVRKSSSSGGSSTHTGSSGTEHGGGSF